LKQAGINLDDWDNAWQNPCRSSRPASPNPKIKQANQCIASVWIYTSSLWIKNKPKIGREICICCCQNSWKNDDMVIKCFQLRIKGVPPPWEFTDRSRAGVGLALCASLRRPLRAALRNLRRFSGHRWIQINTDS
jgi:hypothetical protein